MGTHFIVDAHTTPIGDSPINDIRFSPAANTSPMNGNFVIRVDDNLAVQVENIANLNDLMTEKYAELLAAYPGFSSIIYDDMLDATGVDLATSFGVLLGDRGSCAFAPTDGTYGPSPELRSVMVPLGSTPTQAIVTWELFEVTHSDPIDQLVMHFTVTGTLPSRRYVGSWAVIF
jgi:hypothetical protein